MKRFACSTLKILYLLLLSGCTSITPEIIQNHIQVITPNAENTRYPVVFFFQGSGGTNRRALLWANWFKEYGVASVIIDNAGLRGINNLSRVHYYDDLASSIESVKDNPRLDLSHYGVMGFSAGGSAALESGAALKSKQSKPDFVFSLYGGSTDGCPNSHGKETEVHIFYGDMDEWGNYHGIRNSCEAMAQSHENTLFHLLKDTHHGYDDTDEVHWSRFGQSFISKPNPEALKETKAIILKAMSQRWKLSK